MLPRPPISTPLYSSAASDVYKRQVPELRPIQRADSPEPLAQPRISLTLLEPREHLAQVDTYLECERRHAPDDGVASLPSICRRKSSRDRSSGSRSQVPRCRGCQRTTRAAG